MTRRLNTKIKQAESLMINHRSLNLLRKSKRRKPEVGESAMLSSLLEKVNKKEREFGMVCVVTEDSDEKEGESD